MHRAVKTGRWDKSEDQIEPASPHALYRLADKLDVPEVKKLTMLAIVKGLTVENASTSLSLSPRFPNQADASFP